VSDLVAEGSGELRGIWEGRLLHVALIVRLKAIVGERYALTDFKRTKRFRTSKRSLKLSLSDTTTCRSQGARRSPVGVDRDLLATLVPRFLRSTSKIRPKGRRKIAGMAETHSFSDLRYREILILQ
jgi:hypothetical protein